MKSNYLAIMDWMLELGLTSSELVTYAVVWSFSRDGESWFHGSASYIARWMCKSDRRPALRALASLVDKGLIEKRDRWENGVRLCDYRVSEGSAKMEQVVPEKHRGSTKMVLGGSTKMAHHNKDIDNGYKYPNRDNQDARVRVRSIHGERFKEVWEILLRQPGWTGKSPDALDECMKDLNAVSEEEAVEMVRRSIKNGWKGIFPLPRRSAADEIDDAIAEADRMEREIAERMAARAAAYDIKS